MVNITYILCLYKKDRLRGDFGVLQSGPKGVKSKIGFDCGVYAYILSMGKDRLRVENISHAATHIRRIDGPQLPWERSVINSLSGRYYRQRQPLFREATFRCVPIRLSGLFNNARHPV